MFNEELHIGDLVYVKEQGAVCEVAEFPNDVSVILRIVPGNTKVGFSRDDITTVHISAAGNGGEYLFNGVVRLAEFLLKHREAIYKYAVHAIVDYINEVEFGDDEYDIADGYEAEMKAAVNTLHGLGFGEKEDILRRVRIEVLRERVNPWIVAGMSHEGFQVGDYVTVERGGEEYYYDELGMIAEVNPDKPEPFVIHYPAEMYDQTEALSNIKLKRVFNE